MTRVLVVEPDETVTLRDLTPGDVVAWQKAVGGWLEHLPLTDDVSAIVNEEGKLEGLARNHLAGALVRTFLNSVGRVLHPDDYIAGPAVFFGTPKGGEAGDVPDVVLELLRRGGFKIREEEE